MKNKKDCQLNTKRRLKWNKKFLGLIKPIVNIGNNCYTNAAL